MSPAPRSWPLTSAVRCATAREAIPSLPVRNINTNSISENCIAAASLAFQLFKVTLHGAAAANSSAGKIRRRAS